jgi:serine/threonine protein kinase
MEHLAGETLAARLTKGPLPLEQALEIGAQVAEALDAAHKHGIVHRDLKPANVMLTKASAVQQGALQAKLLDLGLAKLRAAEGVRLVRDSSATVTQGHDVTAAGTLVGTLPYMAPEQVEGTHRGRTNTRSRPRSRRVVRRAVASRRGSPGSPAWSERRSSRGSSPWTDRAA